MVRFRPAAGLVLLPAAFARQSPQPNRLSVNVDLVLLNATVQGRKAAGHIPGTVLPGQTGNLGIAAHRDTFFRPLRNIRQSGIITLTTLSGAYRYRVVSTIVVNPSDVSVPGSDGREILTPVTCFPFYFIGAAPKRFVVRTERVT